MIRYDLSVDGTFRKVVFSEGTNITYFQYLKNLTRQHFSYYDGKMLPCIFVSNLLVLFNAEDIVIQHNIIQHKSLL